MSSLPSYCAPFIIRWKSSNAIDRIVLYRENDKVMILETGEVLTVHEDLSFHMEPGIIVKEKIGRLLMHCEVRPAGPTRQRRDLARWIVAPEPAPPPPDSCLRLDDPSALSAELYPPDVEPVADSTIVDGS